jgi:hypothetical protein
VTAIECMLALTVLLGAILSVGGLIEHVPAYARLMRRRWAARRARQLRRQLIADPWSGAIVRQPRYFTTQWTATTGRAYRAYAESRQSQ